MKSEAVRIAQIERDRELIREVAGILRHPMVAVVLAYVIIEALQKVYVGPKQEPLMGTIVGTTLEAALILEKFTEAAAKVGESVAAPVAALAGAVAK